MNAKWSWLGAMLMVVAGLGCAPARDVTDDPVVPPATTVPHTDPGVDTTPDVTTPDTVPPRDPVTRDPVTPRDPVFRDPATPHEPEITDPDRPRDPAITPDTEPRDDADLPRGVREEPATQLPQIDDHAP